MIYGLPLSITKDNFGIIFNISIQLHNSAIADECCEYLKTIDFENLESLSCVLPFVELIPNLPLNVSKISSNFETLKSDLLTKVSPSTMSTILKCSDLKIESEDSLFEFLLEYSKKWKHECLPLFENIYFEYLSELNLEQFSELHSQYEAYFQFQFRSSLFESVLYILKSKQRLLPQHRHFTKSVSNTLTSLFECRREIESLKNQIHAFQTKYPTLPKKIESIVQPWYTTLHSHLNSSPIQLFKFLRHLYHDQNPHNIKIINLTQSSCQSRYQPSFNIFDYSTSSTWKSEDKPNQWLLFDLKEFSFKIEQISIHVSSGYIPRHWHLLGSNDKKTWITIHDQGNDERCTPNTNCTLEYDIKSDDFFTLFKFEQLDQNYNNSNTCLFYWVEFIGHLNPE
jgi:hypothetical protein